MGLLGKGSRGAWRQPLGQLRTGVCDGARRQSSPCFPDQMRLTIRPRIALKMQDSSADEGREPSAVLTSGRQLLDAYAGPPSCQSLEGYMFFIIACCMLSFITSIIASFMRSFMSF